MQELSGEYSQQALNSLPSN